MAAVSEPELSSAAAPGRPDKRVLLVDDAPIQVLAMAVHDICGRLTAAQLQEMHRRVEQAHLMPRHIGWDIRAAAHAEIFALLAAAADHPALARLLNSGAGLTQHLMIAAGPAAGMMTVNSSKRLLTRLSAGDAEEAARETERHLRVLRFMARLANCSSQTATTP
jgi:DNA-binding GntR family transcriptional regulator